jgi:acyl transferase domain-containing protein
MTDNDQVDIEHSVAIIGMSGRFPGARGITEFWTNIREGVESISRLTADDLVSEGLNPGLLDRPGYVNAAGVLEGVEMFDADFFGFTPREAEILDPAHRIFLECAWEALEVAGYPTTGRDVLVGVYAGAGASSHLTRLARHPSVRKLVGPTQISIGNEKDHLTTKVAYKLGLRGPAVTIQTTCSTSLVAVCQAAQALLTYQCDIALAGGVTVVTPQKAGYFYRQGGILSPDGHCRAFDAAARGTVGGNGAGVVALKRLSDALDDGDHVHAVIRGSAINNDGSEKIGYTAPSITGQADAIALAHAVAGVAPDTIGYVEAHGTGTELGDPIEVAALTQAFRAGTDRRQFCAIGSVKTNVGHLDAAAGVAGLIKAVLAVENGVIPPTVGFRAPNPNIDFESSPFYVATRLVPWPPAQTPRRAGVSSFGIGGTNAHVVIEQAPLAVSETAARSRHLLILSTRSASAVREAASQLADHLEGNAQASLADVEYTLQVGRREFPYRLSVVGSTVTGAAQSLRERAASGLNPSASQHRSVAFLFPGQGAQRPGMAAALYRQERVFRSSFDECAHTLLDDAGLDLRLLVYGEPPVAATLQETESAQPALFAVEYALAQLWLSWGVRPAAMAGHSLGELVAACLAGVIGLRDALVLVAERAMIMQSMPRGSMLAIQLPADQVVTLLPEDVEVAARNAEDTTVVSGDINSIEDLRTRLDDLGVPASRLRTSHAFHSAMMEPAVAKLVDEMRRRVLTAPTMPFLSNLTGTWITATEATDPAYWGRQMRRPVLFDRCLAELLKDPNIALVEVGPGHALSQLARRHPGLSPNHLVLQSLARDERGDDLSQLLGSLGDLWAAGVAVDWRAATPGTGRRRTPLPTYPFERKRYWIASGPEPASHKPMRSGIQRQSRVDDWLSIPTWTRSLQPEPPSTRQRRHFLVFADPLGVGDGVAARLGDRGHEVSLIRLGVDPDASGLGGRTLDPTDDSGYQALVDDLAVAGQLPAHVVHCWAIGLPRTESPEAFRRAHERGLASVLGLLRAWVGSGMPAPSMTVVTDRAFEVTGSEEVDLSPSTLQAACHVIPQEHPAFTFRQIDISSQGISEMIDSRLIDQLVSELEAGSAERLVAYRGPHRWVGGYARLPQPVSDATLLRRGGVYLITGGLGAIGLALARALAGAYRAKLVLVGRSSGDRASTSTHRGRRGNGYLHDGAAAAVREIEQIGSPVMLCQADVSDEVRMRDVFRRAELRFGRVDGVFHAAGETGARAFRPAVQTGAADFERHFRAKVDGTFVLHRIVKDHQVGFVVLFSSLSTVLGGLGFTAYAAANSFLDAFAWAQLDEGDVKWISLDWDGWSFSTVRDDRKSLGAPIRDLALKPAEGTDLLLRLVRPSTPPQVVISTGSLADRLDQWVGLRSGIQARQTSDDGQTPPDVATDPTSYPDTGHDRPKLATPFVAPRGSIEQQVAEVWQQLLGITSVGTEDDFFDLGGHSLMAIQLMSRMREEFGIELSIQEFFDQPTVAGLSSAVDTRAQASAREELDFVAEALDRIEGLSDDEVARFLAGDLPEGDQ